MNIGLALVQDFTIQSGERRLSKMTTGDLSNDESLELTAKIKALEKELAAHGDTHKVLSEQMKRLQVCTYLLPYIGIPSIPLPYIPQNSLQFSISLSAPVIWEWLDFMVSLLVCLAIKVAEKCGY